MVVCLKIFLGITDQYSLIPMQVSDKFFPTSSSNYFRIENFLGVFRLDVCNNLLVHVTSPPSHVFSEDLVLVRDAGL